MPDLVLLQVRLTLICLYYPISIRHPTNPDADAAVLPLQTAHTDDIIHGITPNVNGAKYMLILKHHFNRPDKEGVVRLSKELVEEAVASQRA